MADSDPARLALQLVNGTPLAQAKTTPFVERKVPITERAEFQELAALFERGLATLADHYTVGVLLERLAKEAQQGSGWRSALAATLGTSAANLNKCLQFRQLYKEAELAELNAMRVGWGRLSSAFRIKDQGQRHAFLRESVEECLTDQQVRQKVKAVDGKGRGGGRTRQAPRSFGCQVDLDELVRLATVWREFQEGVWSAQRDRYAQELSDLSTADKERLRQRWSAAREVIVGLKNGCDAALTDLKALEDQLGGEAG